MNSFVIYLAYTLWTTLNERGLLFYWILTMSIWEFDNSMLIFEWQIGFNDMLIFEKKSYLFAWCSFDLQHCIDKTKIHNRHFLLKISHFLVSHSLRWILFFSSRIEFCMHRIGDSTNNAMKNRLNYNMAMAIEYMNAV